MKQWKHGFIAGATADTSNNLIVQRSCPPRPAFIANTLLMRQADVAKRME